MKATFWVKVFDIPLQYMNIKATKKICENIVKFITLKTERNLRVVISLEFELR